MAVRQEDLVVRDAIVYRFPGGMAGARAARQAMMARRRRTLGGLAVMSAVMVLASLPTV